MPVKPSKKEDEYFARLELERRRKKEEEKLKHLAEKEKKRLQELHYMRCPKCGMELSEIDYQAIKVDKCFSCDGIWLDAGEIESIANLKKTSMINIFNVFRK